MNDVKLKDYDTKLEETNAVPWEDWFVEMVAFREKHGNCLVPHGYKSSTGHSLWHWVEKVRRDYAEGKVSEDQFQRLDELHFIWDMEDLRWERGFSALQNFYDEFGHCIVPKGYTSKDKIPLWLWVAQQRDYDGVYPRDKFHRLDAIDFVWNIREYEWERAFGQLEVYKAENGDCLVPEKYIVDGDLDLGAWVTKQRADLHFNFLPQDKMQRLNDLGFSWAATEGSPLIVMMPKDNTGSPESSL